MKKLIYVCFALSIAPAMADVVVLYDGATGNIVTDTAAWNAFTDYGDGTTFGVENDASGAFGTGNAMRQYDFNNTDKPELQGELAAPLLGPFRIDFDSLNQSVSSSSSAIRFRMANTGLSVGSESRTAFSLSWQADGDIGAKYSGVSDANPNDVDTLNTQPLTGVQSVTMIANGALSGTYAYTLFGESRVLDALHYDVYINGVLHNDNPDPDFANGMQFTLESSSVDYDPALGLQRFGLFGSGNSNVDPDVLFDNIILRTGTDIIPEPSTSALLLGAFVAFGIWRRRK